VACAAEELAELERQRLEVLEAQRRRRMQGEGPEEDEEGEEGDEAGEGAGRQLGAAGGMPAGGYAARRAKRARAEDWDERLGGGGASGDALEDDFALGSDDGSGEACVYAVGGASPGLPCNWGGEGSPALALLCSLECCACVCLQGWGEWHTRPCLPSLSARLQLACLSAFVSCWCRRRLRGL
jgi:hypothetical protein